jgi:hypothetical protein
MILLNFSHPLTPDHIIQVESLASQKIGKLIDIPVQFDVSRPFLPQLQSLLADLSISPQEWQTQQFLINLPSFNVITALLLADLHGRMGYFPPVLRLRPVPNAVPPRFEVAEILNLQDTRDMARMQR